MCRIESKSARAITCAVKLAFLLAAFAVTSWAQCGKLVLNPTTGLLDCVGTGSGGGGGGAGTVTSVTSPDSSLNCVNPTTNVQCQVNSALYPSASGNNDFTGQNNLNYNYLSELIPNAVAGTVTAKLVKYTPGAVPMTVTTLATTDPAAAVIGGCTSACGTTGNARIITIGHFDCAFDNAGGTVAGDYVVASTTAAGSCHDAGATPPATGKLGQVLSSNVGPGIYTVDFQMDVAGSGGGGSVASGSTALATASIAANACATVVTATATGTTASNVIVFTPNGSIKALAGYTPAGTLSIAAYPTTNAVNFDVCNKDQVNPSTPGLVTLNWRVF